MQLFYAFILGLLVFSTNAQAIEIDNQEEIKLYTASFKTYKNTSLVNLLNSYGLKIEFILTDFIVGTNKSLLRPGDKAGDVIITMRIVGLNAKPMPCGLEKWMSQGIPKDYKYKQEHNSEITARNGQFLINQPELDPVMLWAATGKCSTEYSLPPAEKSAK